MNYSQTARPQYKYFTLLACLYVTIMVAATTVAYKIVHIGFVTATAASFLFPLTFALNSIIAEVYGETISKKLVWITIICGFLFTIFVTIMIHLPSPANWHKQAAFDAVLGSSIRFAIAGTIGSVIAARMNIFLVTRWKFMVKGKYFALRTIGANTVGEFFLVAITTFLAFVGVFPIREVFSIFIFGYISKVIYTLIISWPAAIAAAYIKHGEQLDVVEDQSTTVAAVTSNV